MNIQIIYFAAVRELVGQDQEHLDWTGEPTVGALIESLQKRHARLVMDGVRVALNEEFCELGDVLSDGAVVALIPPVSGG